MSYLYTVDGPGGIEA